MVQYIITPWRSRAELLALREAFYPASRDRNTADRRTAVSRVSVWVQRGNCPHSVESTALLASAMLNDTPENSTYAVRAAYSAAFSRFVTGLLDGYQDKKHKMSMYAIAQSIGLPATFVELRHQCTHEELPGLGRLRGAAERALAWIWEHYWENLDEEVAGSKGQGECSVVVAEYLRWRTEGKQSKEKRKEFMERLNRWSADEVVGVLMEEMDTSVVEVSMMRESVRLTREFMGTDEDEDGFAMASSIEEGDGGRASRSLEEVRAEIRKSEEALDSIQDTKKSNSREEAHEEDVEMDESGCDEGATGWEIWKGPWVSKPIGIV